MFVFLRCRRGLALPVVALLAALTPVVARAQATQAPAPPAAPRPPASRAAPADAALPTARSIIDRHIAAIGGRAAIVARSSAHMSGTVSLPSAGMTGSVDVFTAKPDKTLLRITLGGIGSIEEGFDGTSRLVPVADDRADAGAGQELEQKRFDSDFLADLHADARYESMTTVEKTDFEGRPCYKVRLVRRGGGEDFEFYDVASGLKAGGITTRESPMGPITSTTIESDYRQFGPLLQATTIKSDDDGHPAGHHARPRSSTTRSIRATFEPPAAIKALLK